MQVNGMTKKIGLIGRPVGHSFSPRIHNGISDRNQQNCIYVAHDVDPNDLETAIKGLQALGYAGVNVTIPHKEAVLGLLDEVDDLAKWVGAVNTISFKQGRAIGTNTDVYGFTQMLDQAGVSLKDKRVAVLGTGGAAKAVIVACGVEGVQSLDLYSRKTETAASCLNKWSGEWQGIDRQPLNYRVWAEKARDYDLVINCTPLGMHPHENRMPVEPNQVKADCVLADIIYNPSETLFLRTGRERGLKTVNGLDMLIFQAIKAYEIWTGVGASSQKVRQEFMTEHM